MFALDTIMKTSYGTQSHLFFTKFWEFPKKNPALSESCPIQCLQKQLPPSEPVSSV